MFLDILKREVLQPLSLNGKSILVLIFLVSTVKTDFVFHKTQIACHWVSLCLNASAHDKDIIELRTLGGVLGDDITSLSGK